MKLEDLFVSHKQVDPVSFSPKTPEFTDDIYLNLERAQKVTSPEEQNEPELENTSEWKVPDKNTYTWVVNNKPIQTKTNTSNTESQQNQTERQIAPSKPDQTKTTKSESNLLKRYRNNENYIVFKQELDKFVQDNPQYNSIKNGLDYLAALESGYKMNVENYQGSTALGWFQFMDNTRHAYNKQSREEFAKDPQAQLKAAAQHYTSLQKQIKKWGGDPNDFVTMYSAWWRPESTRQYLKDSNYNYSTEYNESLSKIRKRASDLFV